MFLAITFSALLTLGPACTPFTANAADWLTKARAAARIPDTRVLHMQFAQTLLQNYQSDRTYEPFFSAFTTGDAWYASGVERTKGQSYFPGTGPFASAEVVSNGKATFARRDTQFVAAERSHGNTAISRPLNPWAVLSDWQSTGDAVVSSKCVYRDYPRVVLSSKSDFGTERLFLDAKTALPVKLDRTEPHYLWGQQHVEYVYSNWKDVDGSLYPTSAFRVVDGENEISRTTGEVSLIAPESGPALRIPDATARMKAPDFFHPTAEPDTIRVSANTYLLRNPMYTVTVTLARDTVFVLDATLSETRARQDSTWIARLFPGPHPIALVVTDLAWPHIGGLRFWVANGATIYTHPASRAFIERVIARRWTLTPDLLEKRRQSARLKLREIGRMSPLASGALKAFPIDGIGSEGALVVYIPADEYLWASDYIQTLREPSQYLNEVVAATQREGVTPARTAAQHLPLSDWTGIVKLSALQSAAVLNSDTIKAGNSSVVGARVHLGVTRKQMSATRNGQTAVAGAMTQSVAATTWQGRSALLSVVQVTSASDVLTDSTIVTRDGLVPLAHRSHNARRTMSLDYESTRIQGAFAPVDSARTDIAQDVSVPLFDSSVIDLVASALPLADGYTAVVPFYVYERGGLVWTTLKTVNDRITVQGAQRDVWRVDFTGIGNLSYWIDRASRAVLRSRYAMPRGELVFEPSM